MTTELNPHLKLCWNLAKRDREKYSPHSREVFDKVFLEYLEKCDWDSSDQRRIESDINRIVQIIDKIQLRLCWHLTKGNSKTYSPYLREAFDKMFLDYLAKCDMHSLSVKDLESALNFIVQSIEDIQYAAPHEPSEDTDSIK